MAASMIVLSDSDSSSTSDEDIVVCAAAAVLIANAVPQRSCWVRGWIGRRPYLGAYSTLMQELALEDEASYKTFVRMKVQQFQELVDIVGPRISRRDTVMRKAISAGERLAVTLRYLGTGQCFTELMMDFRIPASSVQRIVLETCDALYKALKDDFLKVPCTHADWRRIARDFETLWNFPNCIGAIDGKHVRIKDPGEGSTFYNYKEFHSIILLAVVDARYRFVYVDAGANGRAGDAAVFRDSLLASALEENSLNIPTPRPLPGRETPVPFFLVGDDAFPLKTFLMKPYPFRKVSNIRDASEEEERRKQRIFNYRLSRARRICENAFGILSARFRLFQTTMLLSPQNAATVTLAAVALHNFLMTRGDQAFAPPDYLDREDPANGDVILGAWRQDTMLLGALDAHVNRSAASARELRHEIKDFVNDEGRVHWQEQMVFGNIA